MKIQRFSTFLMLVLVLLLLQETFSRTYMENSSKKEVRENFIKKYSNVVTQRKLSFEFNEQKGLYCRANTDLYKSEVTMTIPKELIICGCN